MKKIENKKMEEEMKKLEVGEKKNEVQWNEAWQDLELKLNAIFRDYYIP